MRRTALVRVRAASFHVAKGARRHGAVQGLARAFSRKRKLEAARPSAASRVLGTGTLVENRAPLRILSPDKEGGLAAGTGGGFWAVRGVLAAEGEKLRKTEE